MDDITDLSVGDIARLSVSHDWIPRELIDIAASTGSTDKVRRLVYPVHLTEVDRRFKSETEKKVGCYPYIPSSPGRLVDTINQLKERYLPDTPIHFIDVGCGIGDKPMLAKLMCGVETATGIELNAMTYWLGTFFLLRAGLSEDVHLIHGDALKHDYYPYNLIYMYVPMRNHHHMAILYDRIVSHMRPGSVMVDTSWAVCSRTMIGYDYWEKDESYDPILGIRMTNRGPIVITKGLKDIDYYEPGTMTRRVRARKIKNAYRKTRDRYHLMRYHARCTIRRARRSVTTFMRQEAHNA